MTATCSRNARKRASQRKEVEAVRRFNRFYTRRLGLLNKSYPSPGWTVAEARVLYELANRRDTTARAIAKDLRLDEAYLSRILAKFQKRGLISRSVSDADGRQQTIRLTARGQQAFTPLNRAAAQQVGQQLAGLAPVDCELLTSAMEWIQLLVRDETTSVVTPRYRSLQIGDIGWIIHRQAKLYADEYGWDIAYEALVAEILGDFVRHYGERHDTAWVAELSGQIVGSIFLVRASDKVAKLRLLYVEPVARGLGIGRRLVSECIRGAEERGYEKLTLWTNDVLVSARRIYEAAGFHLVSQEPHRSFGKDLVGQTWDLDLKVHACQRKEA